MSDETNPSDTGVSSWWARLVQGRGDVKDRDQIVELLAGFLERGVLAPDEVTMLQGVLQVADTQVRDIMVPRSHMVVVSKDQTAEEILKIIGDSNHSRFPVIGDDRDEVVGQVGRAFIFDAVQDLTDRAFGLEWADGPVEGRA